MPSRTTYGEKELYAVKEEMEQRPEREAPTYFYPLILLQKLSNIKCEMRARRKWPLRLRHVPARDKKKKQSHGEHATPVFT